MHRCPLEDEDATECLAGDASLEGGSVPDIAMTQTDEGSDQSGSEDTEEELNS